MGHVSLYHLIVANPIFQLDFESFLLSLKDNMWDVIFFGILILIIFHIIISFKQSRFKGISLSDIKAKRKASSLPEDALEQENELALEYLDNTFNHWTLVSAANEEELRKPTKKIHIQKSLEELDKAKMLLPTDQFVIHRINELGEVINSNAKRVFSGSKVLVFAALILGVFLYFSQKTEVHTFWYVILDMWWLWTSILFYIAASFSPQYLIDKRLKHMDTSPYSNTLEAFFAGLLIGVPSFNFLTAKTKGSINLGCMGYLFTILLVGILASLMLVFGIINYLRNFILYY
jgi:hypothetical protein